jgi:hypothetical protein
MATVTAVFTYTGTLGAADFELTQATPYTWAGSNYVDMTPAQTKAAGQVLRAAVMCQNQGASASPVGGYTSQAAAGQGN